VVNTIGERATMKAKAGKEKKKTRVQSSAAVRASISFPADIYETLDIIAKQKKVSLAWVVREAAEQYIGEKWPLFNRGAGAQQ
jgi:predicted DNA-binding ribbon-helix-helix protein